jgi:RNA polymerase sigma factor (sigma-70 family)
MSYDSAIGVTYLRKRSRRLTSSELETELARHHRAAFGWALACCRWDRPTAEDVLQATYLKILDGRARFGGRAEFRTWLYGVIWRTAAEERRRRALGRFLPLSLLEGHGNGQAPGPDPAAAAARADANARLVAALRALPARQRELLHLVFYHELSIAEAAGVLGVAVGTARTHYERGKARLRELLGEGER